MDPSQLIAVGTAVLIRNHFNDVWAPEFEIAGVEGDGYVIRRNRDGAVLPEPIAAADVKALPGARGLHDTGLRAVTQWA